MEEALKKVLISAVIGDALGRPCEGLTKGHLKEHGNLSDDFIDPHPLLKGKMERWTMPGLYSSQAQLMFITAFSSLKAFFDPDVFFGLSLMGIEKGPGEYGIFRNPPFFVRSFLKRLSDQEQIKTGNRINSAGFLPVLFPVALYARSRKKLMLDVISFASIVQADHSLTAAALSLSCFLHGLLCGERPADGEVMSAAVQNNSIVCSEMDGIAPEIFKMGMNPASLTDQLLRLGRILESLSGCTDLDRGEKIICDKVNESLKTPVTRATVDHPFTIYPFVQLMVGSGQCQPDGLLHFCARLGGSSSTLTSIAGIISAALFDENPYPPSLKNGLVNRKLIFSLAESLSRGAVAVNLADEFITAEAGLTKTEIDQRNAKLKHTRSRSTKTSDSYADRHERLSKHVVESWTKIDKARWKKERKKLE